jgi:cytochrome c biogenesis protein CcmG/thiol:disulfide interchange protein DsbE
VPGASLLPACPTALPTFDLATFKSLLAQLHGTPVVVNVWASWCGPCIKEAPELAEASGAHRGRVQFIGVDIQDHGPAATAFIERFGWSYPSVSDPSAAIRDGLGLIGQPNTIFYDRTGKRVHVVSGPVTAQILAAELAKILQA